MPHSAFRRLPVVRLLVHRPRFATALVAGVLCYGLAPLLVTTHGIGRLLVSYDLAATLYVVLAGVMMANSGPATMRRRSLLQDDGKIMVLVVVVVSAIAALLAIAAQLSIAKDIQGTAKIGHVALAAFTVLISWLFTQVMFALHYAHEFYHPRAGEQGGGLEFPGTTTPTYLDFVYFSCVIGTSGQTADVAISGAAMRRFGLLHCVLAYVFNTTVLALTINIAAGLL